MDVVIPFRHSRNNDQELIYSIRSICTYIPIIDDIYIIGDKPRQHLPGVIHKSVSDRVGQNNKWAEANIANKVTVACNLKGLSEEFIYHDDDTFLLKHFDYRYPHKGSLFTSSGYYGHTEANTLHLFRSEETLNNYNVHCPHLFEKTKFLSTVSLLDWSKPYGYQINTAYAVMNGIDGLYSPDLKIKSLRDYATINLSGRKYFSVSDSAFRKPITTFLQETFPNKCKFEI